MHSCLCLFYASLWEDISDLKKHIVSAINIISFPSFFFHPPIYPERSHSYTGRTCKLHTGSSQPGIGPGSLML